MFEDNRIQVKPFVKWAGGKSQLLNTIELNLPFKIGASTVIDEYFEPFVGGGALFFYLKSNCTIRKSYISDINSDLILTYKVIKHNPEELIRCLKKLESNFKGTHEAKKKIYERIRDKFNKFKDELNYDEYPKKRLDNSEDFIQHAGRFIFLNKTCFNGLYRVNSKGHFNVPMGRYKKPLICDETNIRNVSQILDDTVIIENNSYEYFEKDITCNSFVYLDPPYRPVTKTSFTSYTKSNFSEQDQEKLASFCRRISEEKNAKILLSNSGYIDDEDHDNFYFKEYMGFKINPVLAKRYINSNGKNRGDVREVLIRNYDSPYD